MRCQRALPCTSGFLSRASCTRFSPMSVMPAAMASSTKLAGKTFVTAMSVTSDASRPARAHAAAMRARTSATLSRIDTASLHPPPIRPVHGQIRQPVGVLVPGAQRVLDREAAELARQSHRFVEQRNEVRMLHAILAIDLVHEEERVRYDVDLGRSLLLGDQQRLDEARVLRDIVRRRAEEAAELDDLSAIRAHEHAEAGWPGIAARRAVDEGRHFQDCGVST